MNRGVLRVLKLECRGTLICTGEDDWISLSRGREGGPWGLSQCKLNHLGVRWSSAPLLFPYRSLGGRKQVGMRGSHSLKRKLFVSAERLYTYIHIVGTFHLGECCFSCLSSYSAALSTTVRKHLLFYCSFERSPDGSRGPWGPRLLQALSGLRVASQLRRSLDPLRRLVNKREGCRVS